MHGLQKMLEMKHMEVDHEIMRGIPLHRILRRIEVWTSPDEIRRRNWTERVWNLSRPVSNHDIFLSHTWRSKGRWKVLALTMQSGWFHGLLAWFVGVALMMCLRAFDLIRDPWEKVTLFLGGKAIVVPASPWSVMFGGIFMVMGLCISSFLPLKTKICYLDAACIHLAHGELFERGVYSIGGCLSVAKELRVLYSPEYFSSLWCLFEIVGFRNANPNGKLVFSPLFIERSVVICVFLVWCIMLAMYLVISQVPAAVRQGYMVLVYTLVFFVPLVLVVHALRGNFREKKQLIFDLKTFELQKLTCAADFDSAFILSAIDEWYSNRDEFSDFVRGALHDELVNLLPSPALPCTYVPLILSSACAFVLDMGVSMHKSGTDSQTLCIFVFAYLSFTAWYWATFNGVFYLSDKTARLFRDSLLMDWAKTLCVAGGVSMFNFVGFAWLQATTRTTNLFQISLFVLCSLLIPCSFLAFKISKRRDQPRFS